MPKKPLKKKAVKDFNKGAGSYRNYVRVPFLVQQALDKYRNLTDEAVIKKFQTGDMVAFDVLVARYKEPLTNYIREFMDHKSDAEDVVQDTFVKIFNNANAYKNTARFSTWLYTVAANLAKTELRKRKRRRTVNFSAISPFDRSMANAILTNQTEKSIDRRINATILRKALSELPEKYSAIIQFRDIQQFSYEEIAQKMNLPLGTVKSRMNRARNQLEIKIKSLLQNF